MTFRLGRKEEPAEGLRRIALEELDRTRALLVQGRDEVAALHEARKQLKKLRALLELARPALGALALEEGVRLRDAARLLSRHRETDALRTLLEREARIAGSTEFDLLETALRLHQMAHKAPGDRARDLEAARRALGGVRRRLAAAPLEALPRGLCQRRFRRLYKRVRDSLKSLGTTPSVDALHDVRKLSKRLLNQSRILARMGGGSFTVFRAELVAFDDLLGRGRDCGILGALLRGVPAAEAPLRHGLGLRARLERVSEEAAAEALRLGRRIFALGSRDFSGRMFF